MPTQFTVQFLIAGAQKSGTSALAQFLAADPGICIPPAKETHFYDDPAAGESDWGSPAARDRYRSHFTNFAGQPCIGDAIPIAMYLPFVARRIQRYNPKTKLIYLLREPGERAVSQYQHARRLGFERLPFPLALLAEPARLWRDRNDLGWRSSRRVHSYVDRGRYAPQIENMLAYFPRTQMLFLRTEELALEHESVLRRVYEFLEVPVPAALPPSERVFSFPHRESIPAWARRWAARRCLPSTRRLERMLSWDLSEWKAAAE